MKGEAKKNFNAKVAHQLSENVKWIKLEVITSSMNCNVGFVEFIAYFEEQGKSHTLHELSEFHQENGEWYYTNGKIL